MTTKENYKMVIERVFKTMKEIDLEECVWKKSYLRKKLRELNRLAQRIDEENLNKRDEFSINKIKKVYENR